MNKLPHPIHPSLWNVNAIFSAWMLAWWVKVTDEAAEAPVVAAEPLFTFLPTTKSLWRSVLSLASVPLQGSPTLSPFPANGVSRSPQYPAKWACQTHNWHPAFPHQRCCSTTRAVEAIERRLYMAEVGGTCNCTVACNCNLMWRRKRKTYSLS